MTDYEKKNKTKANKFHPVIDYQIFFTLAIIYYIRLYNQCKNRNLILYSKKIKIVTNKLATF